MSVQVRTHQCLACGAITNEDGTPLVTQAKTPPLSNIGAPVVELGEPAEVVNAPAQEPQEVEPEETTEEVEPEEEDPVELPVDLSSLSDDQKEALREALN
jgi:hypothetical protein